jgi:hypothetical protein
MSITQGEVLGTVGGGVLVAFLVNVASNSWQAMNGNGPRSECC